MRSPHPPTPLSRGKPWKRGARRRCSFWLPPLPAAEGPSSARSLGRRERGAGGVRAARSALAHFQQGALSSPPPRMVTSAEPAPAPRPKRSSPRLRIDDLALFIRRSTPNGVRMEVRPPRPFTAAEPHALPVFEGWIPTAEL